jgi:hypothetical protein
VKKFLQAATSKPNLGDNSMQMESILQQWFTTTDEKFLTKEEDRQHQPM